MTKKEIVRKISELADLPQVQTKLIVQWTFDAIIEALIQEGRIELRNFGVFEVKTRRPRTARNPKTLETVQVDAKNVVTFLPGKKMEIAVGKLPKTYLPKGKAAQPSASSANAKKPTPKKAAPTRPAKATKTSKPAKAAKPAKPASAPKTPPAAEPLHSTNAQPEVTNTIPAPTPEFAPVPTATE